MRNESMKKVRMRKGKMIRSKGMGNLLGSVY